MNKLLSLDDTLLGKGLVTCSTGNHALALRFAASELSAWKGLQLPITVVVKENTSPNKLQALKASGVRIIHGQTRSMDECRDTARKLAARLGCVFVDPSDEKIAIGQATTCVEFSEQVAERTRHDLDAAIFVAPGNSGTLKLRKTVNLDYQLCYEELDDLARLTSDCHINFVIPTNEQHLVNGIADFFQDLGVPCCGPSKLAARLEGSKVWAKHFMTRHQIPTGAFQTFESIQAASLFIQSQQVSKVVIKAAGMISGRGVWVTESRTETLDVLVRIFDKREFGPLNQCGPIIIEKFLEGPEFSVLALADGMSAVAFPPMRDYKRRNEGDKGPNTGGMGCQVPVDFNNRDLAREIEGKFLNPTIAGMRAEGYPFIGALCIDFILSDGGPMALEYDVRLGDPESQALLSSLHSEVDLAALLLACTNSEGYPEEPRKGILVDIGNMGEGTGSNSGRDI
ncbi:hypothetical protein DL769_007925 [Monosporascus sp. CRB-8-3]|nr:hypothetical protein DL769_007925 [Monosporascus sp. CRB-8-3]